MKKENENKKENTKKEATKKKDTKKKKQIYFLFNKTEHSGKMEGLKSCSSSTISNSHCIAMRKIPGTVCFECFSENMNHFYGENFINYYDKDFLLKNTIINDDEVPFLNVAYFRIEAFGELDTIYQAINYLKLILKNKHTSFAWWTKRPEIIVEAMKVLNIKPPKNCNFILSSLYLNIEDREKLEKYDFFVGLFTVYEKDFIIKNDIEINCGDRQCINCLKCYKTTKKRFYISEMKKRI